MSIVQYQERASQELSPRERKRRVMSSNWQLGCVSKVGSVYGGF